MMRRSASGGSADVIVSFVCETRHRTASVILTVDKLDLPKARRLAATHAKSADLSARRAGVRAAAIA